MSFADVLDRAVQAKNFRLADCLDVENEVSSEFAADLATIKRRLPASLYTSFKSAIVRTSFLIELTNPTAETDSTKFQVRWVKVLKDQGDIRYAEYSACCKIAEKIAHKIATMDDTQLRVLQDYCSNSIYNFELPIDYIERGALPFHCADNVDIFINDAIIRCTKVRRLIKDSSKNPEADIFKKIISSKIKVKAYQTDRAQTGTHQTNREKRWESHPDNFQFAFRRDCNAIEASLILQVCQFHGVNLALVTMLNENGLLPDNFDYYKCPVTGDVLEYEDFKQEILNRVHGKSAFQVGHLSPLKSSGHHVSDNIGWISDDGNRIQGSLSMEEVDNLLRRIYMNRPELKV